MQMKFSRCIALPVQNKEEAVAYYRDIFNLDPIGPDSEYPEFNFEHTRLFIDENEPLGTILEFIVPDLEAARAELEAKGAEVLRWNGKGKDCYIRDRYGLIFNLWEDPEAFQE